VHTPSGSPTANAGRRAGGGDGNSAGGAQGTFAALTVRNFRHYLSGQALSLIGTWVETVAHALLVLSMTGMDWLGSWSTERSVVTRQEPFNATVVLPLTDEQLAVIEQRKAGSDIRVQLDASGRADGSWAMSGVGHAALELTCVAPASAASTSGSPR